MAQPYQSRSKIAIPKCFLRGLLYLWDFDVALVGSGCSLDRVSGSRAFRNKARHFLASEAEALGKSINDLDIDVWVMPGHIDSPLTPPNLFGDSTAMDIPGLAAPPAGLRPATRYGDPESQAIVNSIRQFVGTLNEVQRVPDSIN
jgi:hypothetical protein